MNEAIRKSSMITMKIILFTIVVIATATIVSNSEQELLAQQEKNQQTNLVEESEERNKAIVLAFTEAFNNHNASVLDNYVAEDIIEHRPGIESGLASTKQFLNSLITAFPDFHTTIDHIIAEDDKVAVFTTTNGTHKGPFMFAPVPPTGKDVTFKTADIYRLDNGKIVEHWDVIDSLDMLREIGAISFNQPNSNASR
jgi:steroid delta-isomerase-like uncharacterized protein